MTLRNIRMLVLLTVGLTSGRILAGGSAYSMYGIGELSLSQTGRPMGMGSLSAPLWSTTSILPQNPASWSAIKFTRIQGSFGYDNITTESASAHALFGTSGIRGMTIAIPFATQHGGTIAVGFVPLSTVQYAVDFGVQPVVDSATYVAKYEGTGGLSTFFLGSSYSPVSWLSLGASLEYNFGAITRSVDAQFNAASEFNHTSIATRQSPDGFDARVAAMLNVGGMTAGATVRLPATLRTKSQQLYVATTYGAKDTAVTTEYDQGLPLAFNAGVSYRVAEFLFAMEYGGESWNSVLVNGVHPTELQSSTSVGFGVERMGNAAASGFDSWSFRMGGLLRTSYLAVNGTSINEAYITAGTSLPVNPQSAIDVGLQYGTRGTTTNGLLQERVFRLNVTFTINERWFQHGD